jgi:hypothetical protein
MTNLEEETRDTIIQSITRQITEQTDAAADDLPPLYQTIDPTIFEYLPEPATLTFPYCGYTVVVNGDRTVAVRDRTDDSLRSEA